MPSVARRVGRRILKARIAASLTQEELAFRAKLSRNYISLLELDEKSPTFKALMAICESLGVRVSLLVAHVERQRKRPLRDHLYWATDCWKSAVGLPTMTAEQKARQQIDRLLEDSGWIVQDRRGMDITAGAGVAVREFAPDRGGQGEGGDAGFAYCVPLRELPAWRRTGGEVEPAGLVAGWQRDAQQFGILWSA